MPVQIDAVHLEAGSGVWPDARPDEATRRKRPPVGVVAHHPAAITQKWGLVGRARRYSAVEGAGLQRVHLPRRLFDPKG
jgi:hypothetical protein